MVQNKNTGKKPSAKDQVAARFKEIANDRKLAEKRIDTAILEESNKDNIEENKTESSNTEKATILKNKQDNLQQDQAPSEQPVLEENKLVQELEPEQEVKQEIEQEIELESEPEPNSEPDSESGSISSENNFSQLKQLKNQNAAKNTSSKSANKKSPYSQIIIKKPKIISRSLSLPETLFDKLDEIAKDTETNNRSYVATILLEKAIADFEKR